MPHFPPKNEKEWCGVLKKLGFGEASRVGKGSHAKKFVHPTKHTSNYRKQPDFIIVQHDMYKLASERIVKELKYFGFDEDDVRNACE